MGVKIKVLISCLIFAATFSSFAAYPVRQKIITNQSIGKVKEGAIQSAKYSWFATHIIARCHHYPDMHGPERRRSDTNGLLSLIFGIAGLSIFPLFSIPAVILGSIGKRHHEEYAHAGYTLGIIGLCLAALALLIVIFLFVSLS